MKKVYIVKASSGSHDDWTWWIHSIWFTPEEAEESKAKLLAKYQQMGNAVCPVGHGDYHNMTDADREKFDVWESDKQEANDFNDASVVELEMGEPK